MSWICPDPWRCPPPLRLRGPASRLGQTGLYTVFFLQLSRRLRREIRRNPPFPLRRPYTNGGKMCIISQTARAGRPRGCQGAAAAPEERLSALAGKCHEMSGSSVSGRIPGFDASPLPLGEGDSSGAPGGCAAVSGIVMPPARRPAGPAGRALRRYRICSYNVPITRNKTLGVFFASAAGRAYSAAVSNTPATGFAGLA